MRLPLGGWRLWPAVLLAVLALAIGAACGGGEDKEPTASPSPGATTPPAAVEGGEITMQVSEPESLDPHFSDFSLDITIQQMTQRGLYDLLPGAELVPAYAEDLPDISADGLTYTIPIKSGMKWANGETLDANDFVFGIQRTCSRVIAGHYQYILTSIGGCDDFYDPEGTAGVDVVTVSAPDDLTLEITLAQPQATFKVLLALWPTYPAPDEALGTVDADWGTPPNTPCSGPFCVTEWVVGDHLTLEKNTSYGLTKAKLDKITLRIIDDFSVAANAYVAGELDMSRVDPSEVTVYENRPDFVKQALPITIGLEYLMTDPVLSDKNVRLALSRATDRDLFNQVVNGSAWIPTTNWVPAEEPGANELGAFEEIIGFDAEAAKKALADAGYAGGAGFPSVSILFTDSAANRAAGEFLQEQWSQVLGITVTLDFVDGQTRQSRFNNSQFQLTLGGWGHDYPDAENWLVGLYETGGSINKQQCSIPEIDDAIAAAKVEAEDEPRWEQLREAERLVVENLCGIAPLYHRGNLYLISPDIQGVEPTLEDHFWPQFPENWSLKQ
ncbi:MAG: peptide ABC transporter substrate-binding protein [Chloroflexi bacterium]|nr:peptide ABC transporter substrate-binding protein [Chloroflexota bacterium]